MVHAEVGGVLGDEVDLLHAAFHESLDLAEDGILGAGAVRAADFRNDTEGAGVVAALGDFHVGVMIRREAEARGIVIRDVFRLQRDEIAGIIRRCGAFGFLDFGGVLLS